jgi:chemotaxis protein MotB
MSRSRRAGNGLDAWPGYVDALSTLLMVIIFVLLVFVLAQAFLSVTLSGRDKALTRLNQQMTELSDMLSLEKNRTSELQLSVAQLTRELGAANGSRDDLARQLAALQAQEQKVAAERDRLAGEQDTLTAKLADATLQAKSAEARNAALQAQIAEAAGRTDAAGQQSATIAAALADARAQVAELQKTVQVNKAAVAARMADLAKMAEQVRALTALRDQLEQQAQDAAAHATTEADRRKAVELQLAQEQKLGDSARAQIALLNQQVGELRDQLAAVSQSLDLAEKAGRDKDAQIAALGQRLNTALAAKVEELQKYRSDFFGKLRQVLANRPGIQIVGDRFVFQSEVLFPVGSADLTDSGTRRIQELAATIKQIAPEIPPDIHWILRVDGHADHQPVDPNGPFASNWELSTQRAVNVVKLLVALGVPPQHLAAAGFADFQPLDPANTPAAYAKNRRIELRLTD